MTLSKGFDSNHASDNIGKYELVQVSIIYAIYRIFPWNQILEA